MTESVVPTSSSYPTHLFIELTSLDELAFPTSSSARIKVSIVLGCNLFHILVHIQYTCLDASAHYLAVGSTSGTVYLFSRYIASRYRKTASSLSCVPVQVIASKEGAVSQLLLTQSEKYLASI